MTETKRHNSPKVDPALAESTSAWPFVEARKVIDRYKAGAPAKGAVLFETGYGPSGLPHIGTFGEVARTTMVRHAFEAMSNVPTRLIAFSDDMDGLRKVPTNLPNQDMLKEHLGMPLTSIPDPFGSHESFAHHNNARLRAFLDSFGFEYEFKSSTECYKNGDFDATLLKVLAHYDAIMAVMLPSLGAERRATYSPFLPLCPDTGVVLQVPLLARDVGAGTITFETARGRKVEQPVTGGHAKLQWKVDWAMRWVALGVDYEMSGKDLVDSVRLSDRIAKILGAAPPEGFQYELFVDENGRKISKSIGNGLTMDEWLRYASPESLSLYMYQSPRKAKRLYFDVIPKTADEYLTHLEKFPGQSPQEQLANPVWHIHGGAPPAETVPVSFGLLLNLVGAANTGDPAVLWGFISRYAPGASPETQPLLAKLVGYAANYYEDFVKPTKKFRAPDARERAAMDDLLGVLEGLPESATGDEIQTQVYEVGKRHGFETLRDWFKALYEVLLGQEQGPRIGPFFALYGLAESIAMLKAALAEDSGKPVDSLAV
jgi:lysyl-tRNA synthetase, class I